MNCPSCHRQNVDTAKFCGNCGTPFPREDLVSSSLVNCGQGHIYSAVYDRCPYCPASESIEPVAASGTADKRRAPASDLGRWGKSTGDLSGVFSNPEQRRESRPSADVASPDSPPQLRLAEKREIIESANPVDSAADRMPPPPPPAPPIQPLNTAPSQAQQSDNSNSSDRRTVIISADDVKRTSDRRLVGWLVTFSGHPEGKDFRVRAGVNRIGAKGQCDIVIDDDAVSSSHALIVCRDGECSIRDDFSTNGTFVNDVRVTEAQKIANNDHLRVGNTELRLILIDV